MAHKWWKVSNNDFLEDMCSSSDSGRCTHFLSKQQRFQPTDKPIRGADFLVGPGSYSIKSQFEFNGGTGKGTFGASRRRDLYDTLVFSGHTPSPKSTAQYIHQPDHSISNYPDPKERKPKSNLKVIFPINNEIPSAHNKEKHNDEELSREIEEIFKITDKWIRSNASSALVDVSMPQVLPHESHKVKKAGFLGSDKRWGENGFIDIQLRSGCLPGASSPGPSTLNLSRDIATPSNNVRCMPKLQRDLLKKQRPATTKELSGLSDSGHRRSTLRLGSSDAPKLDDIKTVVDRDIMSKYKGA